MIELAANKPLRFGSEVRFQRFPGHRCRIRLSVEALEDMHPGSRSIPSGFGMNEARSPNRLRDRANDLPDR